MDQSTRPGGSSQAGAAGPGNRLDPHDHGNSISLLTQPVSSRVTGASPAIPSNRIDLNWRILVVRPAPVRCESASPAAGVKASRRLFGRRGLDSCEDWAKFRRHGRKPVMLPVPGRHRHGRAAPARRRLRGHAERGVPPVSVVVLDPGDHPLLAHRRGDGVLADPLPGLASSRRAATSTARRCGGRPLRPGSDPAGRWCRSSPRRPVTGRRCGPSPGRPLTQ
jgi:hypothetical protein